MLRNLSKFRLAARRLQQAATPWAWPAVRHLSSVPDARDNLAAKSDMPLLPASSEPDRVRMFRYLNLKTFADDEIAAAHLVLAAHTHTHRAQASDADIELFKIAQELNLMQPTVAVPPTNESSDSAPALAAAAGGGALQVQVLPLAEFRAQIKKVGEQLDIRVWPVALSFAATGLSIGIIIPILPILVREINIPTSVFGLAVSSFGLAKLMVCCVWCVYVCAAQVC